jgi:hypothetical protein
MFPCRSNRKDRRCRPFPLDDRTQILRVFETHLRNQRYYNWNFSLQRQIARESVLTVRYVATKGSRLLAGVDLNQGEIFANGFWTPSL